MRFCLLVVFFSIYGIHQFGYSQQINKLYTKEFSQLDKAFVLRNPSYVQSDSKGSIQIGYNGFNRLSNNIRSMYLTSTLVINSTHKRKQFIGFDVSSHEEGKFIRQYRPQFRYCISIPLTAKSNLLAATSLGVFNHTIDANTVTYSESRAVPDGTIGVKYSYTRFNTGFSATQLFENRFTTYEYPSQLIRIYYISNGYTFKLSPDESTNLEVMSFLKSPDEFKTITSWWNISLVLWRKYEVSTLFHDLETINFSAGIREIPIDNHKIGIYMSYMSNSVDERYISNGNMEIIIKYNWN